MSGKLQNKKNHAIREKTQYGLTFGVIAMMLFVAGFPSVVIFFFGIFAYFLWKTFSSSPRTGVREIFEFYLSANSILRDDERRWFGFEVQDVIAQGERVVRTMHGAPPLVYFALGALYNKIGNHEQAVKHLSYVVEDEHADEASYVHPSVDLKSYVKVLRKIEQEPSEAQQTSASIRALERKRKNRGKALLEDSREKFSNANGHQPQIAEHGKRVNRQVESGKEDKVFLQTVADTWSGREEQNPSGHEKPQSVRRKPKVRDLDEKGRTDDDLFANRKPITEVLHDIYDKNIQ